MLIKITLLILLGVISTQKTSFITRQTNLIAHILARASMSYVSSQDFNFGLTYITNTVL